MMLLVVLIVIVVACVLRARLRGLDYEYRRIKHYQQRLGAKKTRERTPLLNLSFLQNAATTKKHVSLPEVRDFVITLQLGTSMAASLGGSLNKAAEQFAGRGYFGERLQKHVEARLSTISPEAVLEGLASDFDNKHLGALLERVRMASQGGISYNRVFTLTANEIQEDIRTDIEQQIKRAPLRLTPFMISGLFTPVLLLIIIPFVVGFLTGLGGR